MKLFRYLSVKERNMISIGKKITDAYEMIERIKNKKELDDEWLEMRDEIVQFLKEDHPEEEKKLFRPFGYLEVVTMICDGLKRR